MVREGTDLKQKKREIVDLIDALQSFLLQNMFTLNRLLKSSKYQGKLQLLSLS